MTLIPINPPPPPPPPAMRIEDVILTLQKTYFELDDSNPDIPSCYGLAGEGSQMLNVEYDGYRILQIRNANTCELVGDLWFCLDEERSHIPMSDVLEILGKAKFKRTTENWPHSYISETKEAKVSVDVTGYYVGQTKYAPYQDHADILIRDTATGRDCRASLYFDIEG